jgi:hypothetical protein
VLIHAVSDHSNHRRHWKSQTTEAGDSAVGTGWGQN